MVREGGHEYIRNKVLRNLLSGERDLIARGQPLRAQFVSKNYSFIDGGPIEDGLQRIILKPNRKSDGIVNGSIWLDTEANALVRVEGRLLKSPSFWIRDVDVTWKYARVDGHDLPVEMISAGRVRIFGRSTFKMNYDYVSIEGRAVTDEMKAVLRAPLHVAPGWRWYAFCKSVHREHEGTAHRANSGTRVRTAVRMGRDLGHRLGRRAVSSEWCRASIRLRRLPIAPSAGSRPAAPTRTRPVGWKRGRSFVPASRLTFEVVDEGGSEYVRNKILRGMLVSEQELVANGKPLRAALDAKNYELEDGGTTEDGLQRVSLKAARKSEGIVNGACSSSPRPVT